MKSLKVNYQKMLDEILADRETEGKTLLLHSCCAPCSSYVLTYLANYFRITVLYYNPNISMEEEYQKRVKEQKRLIETLNCEKQSKYPIDLLEGDYEPECFFEMVRGLENEPEGGKRCFLCYRQRLKKTAEIAKKNGFDYFTTTLSISPLKNEQWLNEIGKGLMEEYQVHYLFSDFKKKNGYKMSIELSSKYGLYRQDYCGCIYSKLEREKQKEERNKERNE